MRSCSCCCARRCSPSDPMKASRVITRGKHRRLAQEKDATSARLRFAGLFLCALMVIAGAGLGVFYAVFSQTFPSLTRFQTYFAERPEPTRFYARDGETLLFTLAYENNSGRDLALCESDGEGCLPRKLIEAVKLSREDRVRKGAAVGFAEEMVREVYAGEITSSRHPDLLARLLTAQIRRQYSADELTVLYLNHAWFGQMAFGPDAAAKLYLDKSGDQLTDAECVLFSAIVETPALNPIDSHGAVRDAYLKQLRLLHEHGLFSEEESEALGRANFTIFEPPAYAGGSEPDLITRKALDAVIAAYGRERVERGGLTVITSEDAELQAYIVCAVSGGDEEECPLSSAFSESERNSTADTLHGSAVSAALIDVVSGQLLAAVESAGGTFSDSERAYPVGTSMNYFAALTAFANGSAPSQLLWDLEGTEDEPARGPIRLRDAAVNDCQRCLTTLMGTYGSAAVQNEAALFGLTNSHGTPKNGILNEGGHYTAEEFAFALTPFASLGTQTGTGSSILHPISVSSVRFSDGTTDEPQPRTSRAILSEGLAYLVHHVFSQDTMSMNLSERPAAVKIGKTAVDDSRWVSGYTPTTAAAVRIGETETVSAFTVDENRVETAAKIFWRSVMEFAERGKPVSGWQSPDDISRVRVCLPSGKLPTEACQNTVTEVFLKGAEPWEYDDFYTEVTVNKENGLLATRFTPVSDRETKVFLTLPENARAWAEENGIESVPTDYDPIPALTSAGSVLIETPSSFALLTDGDALNVTVELNLPQSAASWEVTVGDGMFPERWTKVCEGGGLDNGRWRLCEVADLEPGLHVLRVSFILPDSRYESAETYFIIEQ